MDERKLARIEVTYVLLEELLRGHLRPVAWSSAPPDIEVVDVGSEWTDRVSRKFYVIAWSASFAAVPEGALLPLMDVHYGDKAPEVEEVRA